MARARNIKPGFFTNDKLAETGPYGMILFEGLWCLADREGKLEDRPKKIKIEILPYFDVDVDALLNNLASAGFITRYEIDGDFYIQICNFSKHQNPHPNEKPSVIPDVREKSRAVTKKRDDSITNRADSGYLIPDSMSSESISPPSPSEGEAPDDAKPELTVLDGGKGKSRRSRPRYSAEFETFWEAYPSGHGNKQRAFTEWRKLKPDDETIAKIMAGLDGWKQCRRWRDGFIKAAETWLKDAWWENEPPGVNVHSIRKSLNINDYAPDEWPSLAYGPANTPEERELSRLAAERLMG